jgi:hypothetical protein
MTEPLLNKQDIESPTWKKIEQYLLDDLHRMRKKNDDPRLTNDQTMGVRGYIGAIKNALELSPEYREKDI